MNKNLKTLIDTYNNMDLTHPIQKIDLDAGEQSREVWKYFQENYWNNANRDIIVVHLKKICDDYLATRKDSLKE